MIYVINLLNENNKPVAGNQSRYAATLEQARTLAHAELDKNGWAHHAHIALARGGGHVENVYRLSE